MRFVEAMGLWALLMSTTTVAAQPRDVCQLPLDSGNCRGRMMRFYFNTAARRCDMFAYSGCDGNGNRFSSLSVCQGACEHLVPFQNNTRHVKSPRCLEGPLEPGVVEECRGFFPRYTFSQGTLSCRHYAFGGCNAGSNLFTTETNCMATCIHGAAGVLGVEEPAQTARSLFAARGASEPARPQDATMIAPASPTNDVCKMAAVNPTFVGCFASIPKWTFDWRQNKCVKFVYGGCGGTENLFSTEEECIERCPSKTSDEDGEMLQTVEVCSLPKKTGPCRAAMPRFAFHQDTKRCELFIFGGCSANGNNFLTMEECVNTCGGMEPSVDAGCNHVQCNQGEITLNEAKGCKPIVAPDECCPSAWDCSVWEERLNRSSECFIVTKSMPNGKYYAVGEAVPEADLNCRAACFCTDNGVGNAEIMCAIMDCAWNHDGGKHCVNTYRDPGQCCPSATDCYEREEDIEKVCELEGKSYTEGELISPSSATCKTCLCKRGWNNNGTLEGNEEFCQDVDCGLNAASDDLLRGCQPVFIENVCCPVDWICPDPVEPPPPPPPPTSCPPGVNPVELVEQSADLAVILDASDADNDQPPSVCLLPRPISSCEGYADKWFFDRVAGKCRVFRFGGPEDAEGNVFDDEESCAAACSEFVTEEEEEEAPTPCEEPKSSGPCYAFMPKYFFDSDSKTCRMFAYGGCGGNRNRFETLEECTSACPADQTAQEGLMERCGLSARQGRCRGSFNRFMFDPATRECKQFTYGGCDGNGNNFETRTDCELACKFEPQTFEAVKPRSPVEEEDICSLPKKVGLCRALIPRYYFDRDAWECKFFNYGGCGGNENNFVEMSDCQSRCGAYSKTPRQLDGRGPGCNLEVEAGPCYALMPRFYFDTTTNTCKLFMYGGCLGNDNNFADEKTCLRRCGLLPEIEFEREETKICRFNGRAYQLGTRVRSRSRCSICSCSSPPYLTCEQKRCQSTAQASSDQEGCEAVYDEDGCCITGYRCRKQRSVDFSVVDA